MFSLARLEPKIKPAEFISVGLAFTPQLAHWLAFFSRERINTLGQPKLRYPDYPVKRTCVYTLPSNTLAFP